MARITVTDTVNAPVRVFDDEELQATYSAQFLDGGRVEVRVGVYRDGQLITTLPCQTFPADQAAGFSQD